ncbi:hypothetical protein [Phytohabitans kaempferiae]|uniref:Uncharacterized protein n=1 Tax=Phytohabitans kaempferiae TaxID=1620943 RepID=A0ABV6LZT6_9ACTN
MTTEDQSLFGQQRPILPDPPEGEETVPDNLGALADEILSDAPAVNEAGKAADNIERWR